MANPNALQFKDMVREDLILCDLNVASRDEALETMASLLVEKGYCEKPYVAAILDREKNHPSALPMPGQKIAIPHADATYVNNSALLFARVTKPLEFRSMGDPDEKLQVSMISMFALKEKWMIGDLLETLINVYQDEDVLDAIMKAADEKEIFEILKTNVHEKQKR
ncbi:MAG: PTS sugar transporter subunit IIA [Spirochaetales bacterium]|nr:PTS sugar transporter subunit IIA [Spirochaetales bacterium]